MADDKIQTIALSKLAAELAEKHEMSKKAAGEFLGAFVELTVKNLKKGHKVRVTGLGIFQVKEAPRPHGPQPCDRRSHQDQGVEEARLPRRQGSQGRHLALGLTDQVIPPGRNMR